MISSMFFQTSCFKVNFSLSVHFQSSLAGHKNIIKYLDSSITVANNGVYEVLVLMQYCRSK